jgi:hypothetical protein
MTGSMDLPCSVKKYKTDTVERLPASFLTNRFISNAAQVALQFVETLGPVAKAGQNRPPPPAADDFDDILHIAVTGLFFLVSHFKKSKTVS